MTPVVKFVKEAELGSVLDDQATQAMGEAFEAPVKFLMKPGNRALFTRPSPNASSKLRNRASVIRTS